MDCIFCKIVSGDIPSHKVYEDDKVMAFFDILPISHGHTIIVPKEHVADLENLPDDTLCAMALAIKKIGKAVMEGLGVKGYSVFLDDKSAANQHVNGEKNFGYVLWKIMNFGIWVNSNDVRI